MISFELISLAFFVILRLADAIPIDNGVEGAPEIECDSTAISITVKTRNEFQGRVFVKGRFNETTCRSDDNVGRRAAGIIVPFTECGLFRSRSLNPRGVFVVFTVIVSFHPFFLTKVDRAYTIQCFYMEADKTVGQEIQVSEVTTVFRTQTVPMPTCRYEILDRSPDGKRIKFVVIGQQVYHKWTCETDTTDVFCMNVHFCFVSDGSGNNVDLIDPNGCALDKFLLGNLEYSTDLMAGRESHAFKFADVPALIFRCQIAITIKEPGEQCPIRRCDEPQQGKRRRSATNVIGVVDVSSQNLFALDVDEDEMKSFANVDRRDICLTKSKKYILILFSSTFLFYFSISLFVCCSRKRWKKTT